MKADPGEKALVNIHTGGVRGSIGLVNILNAIRLQAQGLRNIDPALWSWRDARHPARIPNWAMRLFRVTSNFNKNLERFMKEGGKVYACRFALQALIRSW